MAKAKKKHVIEEVKSSLFCIKCAVSIQTSTGKATFPKNFFMNRLSLKTAGSNEPEE